MSCENMKTQLVDLLYDEISDEDRQRITEHVESCASCQAEFAHLTSTSEVLKKWPDEEPHLNLVFVQEKRSFWEGITDALSDFAVPWAKGVRLAGAGVLGLFLVLGLLNTEITYTDQGVSVRFALFAPEKEPVQPATVADRFARVGQGQLDIVAEMIRQSEIRQERKLGVSLARLANGVEQQRQLDLKLIGRQLEGVQQNTESRLARTNEMLNGFIQLTSAGRLDRR